MSLLLAPYNNGMRLGQGFNSYTHEICVDNAVVINPERAENVISNNGTTMRIAAQAQKKASLWRQLTEYVNDGQAVPATMSTEPNLDERPLPASEDPAPATVESSAASQDKYRGLAHSMNEADDAQRRAEMVKAAEELAQKEKKRLIEEAKNSTQAEAGTSPADPEKMTKGQVDDALKKDADAQTTEVKQRKADATARLDNKAQEFMEIDDSGDALKAKDTEYKNKLKDQGQGIKITGGKVYAWTKEDAAKGPSQTVTYCARFVDKLSEINKDMSGSAALVITGSSFSGSGNAAFVDTQKFFDSDIRFYLSVKVINQSINFKDALEYNPIRSVSEKDPKLFNTVFGDSFISGFIEGGELNAVVMIKVLNDAKKTDIKAEAKVALTVSKDLDIDGAGNVAIAKKNLKMNTEISIQVRWAGGGSIKPYDEEWSIDSLMAAANRFPYLVAQYPQRTHAILTKYTALRSFIMLKSPRISPLQYENATILTDTLLDYYLEYTLLAKRVSADIVSIQNGVKQFKAVAPVSLDTPKSVSVSLQTVKQANGEPLKKFDRSLEGLDLARKGIRAQINAIVKEVNWLTSHPEDAIKKRVKHYVGPASFQSLIPEVEYKVRRMRNTALTNQNMTIDTPSKDEQRGNLEPKLFDPSSSTLALSEQERIKVTDLERDNPELAEITRLSPPVGSLTAGTMFCTIDVGLQDPVPSEISVGKHDKVVRSLSVTFTNGFTMEFGDRMRDYAPADPTAKGTPDDESKIRYTLRGLGTAEMVVSAKIEVDGAGAEDTVSVIGVRFVTNKGQVLKALSTAERTKHYEVHHFEKPITDGYISGFWGRAKSTAKPGKDAVSSEAESKPGVVKTVEEDKFGRITKLGLVWTQAFAKNTVFDDEPTIECLTPLQPEAPTASEKVEVKFGRMYPGEPQLVWGIRQLQLSGAQDAQCTGFKQLLADRFSYTHTSTNGTALAHSDWMVVPEINANIQCGEVTIEADQLEVTETVNFTYAFKKGSKIEVVCWLIDFTTTGQVLDLKATVVPSSVEDGSFKIKISNSTGDASTTSTKRAICANKVTVGWLAYDQPTKEEKVTFQAGAVGCEIGLKGKSVYDLKFDNIFEAPPAHHFVALSSINCQLDGKATSFKPEVKESTTQKLKLEVESRPAAKYDLLWISSM